MHATFADMFDVIVIGSGPAGLSAALMLGRCRRRVLLCDLGEPRNRRSKALQGYLTRDGIASGVLTDLGRAELAAYGVEHRGVGVTVAAAAGDTFRLSLTTGSKVKARYLLITTGIIDDLPGIPGPAECYGLSVFHCPYGDGGECRDRALAVLGRGAPLAAQALGLRTWTADLVVCTNSGPLDRRARARLARNGIEVRSERIARLAHEDGALIRHGTVRTGTLCDTNVSRVFGAGDASRDAPFAIVAAAEGVKAAVAIDKALQREELVA